MESLQVFVTRTTTLSTLAAASTSGASLSVERPPSSMNVGPNKHNNRRLRQLRQSLVLPILDFTSWSSHPSSSSSAVTLEHLDPDVLFLVFRHLSWPIDLYNLALVSRSLNTSVTPELYKTIVVLPSPRIALSLLDKLDSDQVARDAVQTLVFDFLVRSVKPGLSDLSTSASLKGKDLSSPHYSDPIRGVPDSEKWGDPHRVRLRLYRVLPKLRHVRNVYVKRWHHMTMGPLSASECYHYWNPSSTSQKSRKFIGRFRRPPRYEGPPAVMHGDREPNPLDIISLLMLRCKELRKLYVTGVFPSLRVSQLNYPIWIWNLTTLVIGEQTAGVSVWNDVLRRCTRLRVLALLNVHFRFEKLMAGCLFPWLESIGMYTCYHISMMLTGWCELEWYGYAFSSASTRKQYKLKAFTDFIQKHQATLKCISLAPRIYQPLRGLTYQDGLPFFEPDSGVCPSAPLFVIQLADRFYKHLLKLETLRLKNWSVFITDHDSWPHTQSTQFRALAEQICRFVERRPSLVDITITDLPEDLELHLRQVLEKRDMRRLMVGGNLLASRLTQVPLEVDTVRYLGQRWVLPGEWVRRQQTEFMRAQKRDYLLELWQSYEVMFEGLALAESGYRPLLAESRCPRRWMDYLRMRDAF